MLQTDCSCQALLGLLINSYSNHTLINNQSNCGNLSILNQFNVNCGESKARTSLSGGERNPSRGTIILNVGGSIHQVKWETIDKFPKSRLQRLCYATSESKSNQERQPFQWDLKNFPISAAIQSLCDAFSLDNREFYFDRSPRVFENILGLYRKGELHLTESVCPRDFLGELEYWGLSPLYLGNSFQNIIFMHWLFQNLAAPTHYKERPGCYQSLIKVSIMRMR